MAGETVTVACKLPNGLLLRVFDMVPGFEPVLGGGTREIKVARQKGEPVKINGNAVPFGMPPAYTIIGGYALTPNVDAAFWAEWLKHNADSDVVKSGLIHAHATPDAVQKESRNREKVKSGLEPLDPENPMKGIKRADKKAA